MEAEKIFPDKHKNKLPPDKGQDSLLQADRPQCQLSRQTYCLSWNHRPGDAVVPFYIVAEAVCKAMPGIKTTNQFIKLLETQPENVIIIIPRFHLAPFMALMQLFYECKRISCHGNHGIFAFMVQHAMNPETNRHYTSGQIRNQLFRIRQDPCRKEHIKKRIKDIYFQACTLDSDKILFKNHFS